MKQRTNKKAKKKKKTIIQFKHGNSYTIKCALNVFIVCRLLTNAIF